MIKKVLLVLIVLVVIAIGIYAVVYVPKQKAFVANMNVPFAESRAYCFTRSQSATAEAPYAVTEHIKLTRVRDQITGTKYGTQTGPDMTNGYSGYLAGTLVDNKGEFMFAYTIEGSAQTEIEDYYVEGTTMVKERYPLVEEVRDGVTMLVPDRTQTPTRISYASEPCK